MSSVKVVIAPDKFKGSLTSCEAARCMAQGVKDSIPEANVELCPMADGGEGTLDAFIEATGAVVHVERVRGPLPGQEVEARWAYIEPGGLSGMSEEERSDSFGGFDIRKPVAVIEMAEASGLSLITPVGLRNPLVTNTFGTGELIRSALDKGIRQIVVGIGGSATVDGGTGMAHALGIHFLDESGVEIEPCGGTLERIREIDVRERDPRIQEAKIIVASDVDNPLTGEGGAARVFGPQKGATKEQVEVLERGLVNLSKVIRKTLRIDVSELKGGGAAGGLGAGLYAFCGAEIRSGVETTAKILGFERLLEGASLVLTGEGSLDAQTTHGKVPAGVCDIATRKEIPTVILAGSVSEEFSPGHLCAVFSIVPGPVERDEAMEKAGEFLRIATARLMRLLSIAALVFGPQGGEPRTLY